MDPLDIDRGTVARYAVFAERDARGSSPTYEAWARGVCTDPDVLALIDELPETQRQPNLVFAAARSLGAPVEPYPAFRAWLLARWREVAVVARARRTQTNEAGRCATLLPVLGEIDGPVALLEVGASAGLCLYPDRYSYLYDGPEAVVRVDPADGPSAVVLPCRIGSARDVPGRVPDVVWRAGIDLEPLRVTDAGDMAWLSALVWPEHDARRQRLVDAARIAAQEPPTIVRGDLVTTLAATAEQAPADATLVVFHSAVLAYLEAAERQAFVRTVTELGATWISNEGERVVPDVARQLPPGVEVGNRFVLSRDGIPRALVDPHGASYTALG